MISKWTSFFLSENASKSGVFYDSYVARAALHILPFQAVPPGFGFSGLSFVQL